MKRVYLDNAASTPLDKEVLEHMLPYLTAAPGNPSSSHAYGRELRALIESSRRTIAGHLGVSPSEIIFTSGGTEADNMAINGAVASHGIQHIISSPIEHHAVTHTIESLEKEGKAHVTWLSPDSKGYIDLKELEEALTQHPKSLVSLMHANNEIGTIQDIHAIGEICGKYEALFHSDTVQSMCNCPLDFSDINIHFAAASAHKFYGPKGIGFLYVKKGIKIPAMILGGSQERNMRAGTENAIAIAGMGFAFDKCHKSIEKKRSHLLTLKNHMAKELSRNFPGVQVNGEADFSKALPTVLNVSFPAENDLMLLFSLDIAGIAVSAGSACNSGANIGSHVLRGIGCSPERALNAIRFSFGVANTLEEIDFTIEKLTEILPIPAS